MKSNNVTLYHVTTTNKSALHQPRSISIPQHDRKLIMIPLSETPEGALMLAYPTLTETEWKTKTFTLWEIERQPRHGIRSPKIIGRMWDVKYAVELGLWACPRNLRMKKVKDFTVINNPKKVELVTVTEGEETIILGSKYPVNI